jgi:hypothetical protein
MNRNESLLSQVSALEEKNKRLDEIAGQTLYNRAENFKLKIESVLSKPRLNTNSDLSSRREGGM